MLNLLLATAMCLPTTDDVMSYSINEISQDLVDRVESTEGINLVPLGMIVGQDDYENEDEIGSDQIFPPWRKDPPSDKPKEEPVSQPPSNPDSGIWYPGKQVYELLAELVRVLKTTLWLIPWMVMIFFAAILFKVLAFGGNGIADMIEALMNIKNKFKGE